MWCERLVVVLISLLAGGCAGQWAVVKGYRVVMKADIVRDFPGMCYDVSSCSARAVNESWAIGICSRAACEVDDSGILLEVHYTCPRLQNRPTLMCDIIEDKRLPFPACCPRMICQRHKKQPPPTQTKLKPFTPHATVDKELRKIPFVLKRFLEVQNTTLLDAIILNRIKALEAAANASVVYMGQGFNVSFNSSSDIEGFSEAALTTEGPGTTTQDTTPFATTEDSVTTPSPTPSSTAQTLQATTTTTEAPVVILNGTGFQSESLEFQPRQNVSLDDDELSFLNDAPVVPADDTTPSSRPETTRTATVEKTTSETATITPDVVPVTTSVAQVATELTESEPASPTERTITAEVHDTTRTVALTVPESIFHTTIVPTTEPSTTTTTAPVQDELKTKSTPGKKDSNLPTILRSLVDNVFDYYDYIDYYVPGQKRNASSTQEKEAGDTERRKIPESMMELVKKQLTKQTTKDENVGTDSYEDLPQGDQPPSEEAEATTADPDDKELQKELVTKVEVDLHRMPKPGSQEDSTRAPATTTTTTNTAAQETTTKVASVTTVTAKASEVPVSTTIPEQVRTDTTTEASVNLVKSVGAEQPRRGVNLLVENLAAPGPEQRTTTGATTASFTTTQAPTTTATTTTLAPQTPPSTTQKATTAAPTTPEATEHPTTQTTTTTTTQAPTTRPATRTVPFEVITTTAPRTTKPDVTTETPLSTTAVPSTTTSPVTSVPTTPEPTSRRAETDAVTEVRRTETNSPTSSATSATPAPTTGDLLITKTAPPLSSESLLADRQNATAIPLLTTTEATTVGVTTASATTRAPSTARLTTTTQQAKQSPATGSDLVKDERSQKAVNGTTKSPKAPSQNNDVEYIDYVYYYDYVDVPDNSTTNGTSLSRNSTGVQPTQLKQNVTQ